MNYTKIYNITQAAGRINCPLNSFIMPFFKPTTDRCLWLTHTDTQAHMHILIRNILFEFVSLVSYRLQAKPIFRLSCQSIARAK